MSSFIQINIYNESLESLKSRGICLQSWLKTIGCSESWITDVPIPLAPDGANGSKPFKDNAPAEMSSAETFPTGNVPKNQEERGQWEQETKEWDATLTYDPSRTFSTSQAPMTPSTSSTFNSSDEHLFKAPKMEQLDETNDSSQTNELEMSMIQDLWSQNVFGNGTGVGSNVPTSLAMNGMNGIVKTRRKLMIEDPDISNTVYSIVCHYPNCHHQYNWRVKYGKLRLLDHALTHSDRRIPCKICGFKALNVRRVRSHYAKEHPSERVQGYGMKTLISGDLDGEGGGNQMNDEELKELWRKCYSPWIELIGEASGYQEGDRPRRTPLKKKTADEAPEPEMAKVTRSTSKR
ncbi:unnamed protein product [Caenorhabditis sp. 36 PRJEB53466]|nr:unnamed protein product [Caenorhabditis sp. 36 PRJEB53466]